MGLNNMEKVETSLPDVQSREMQILEEENDANMQRKLNTSIWRVCNKDAVDKYISCSESHIQIHHRCTFLPSYQLYYFVEKESKYTCVNYTPTGLVDLSSDGVDVLINDILPENLKEVNSLKYKINKDTDINGKLNTIDVSINENINIMRNNGNYERFIDEFVDFKKFVTAEFQNINQKIVNLNMKDQYPQENTLNERQE